MPGPNRRGMVPAVAARPALDGAGLVAFGPADPPVVDSLFRGSMRRNVPRVEGFPAGRFHGGLARTSAVPEHTPPNYRCRG
ncbi:MAG: hypothetical protein M3552_13510 [Planctomycetota bacterium]|nr:hypothetical protein [Planctomycetota bacterium]